jgi:peptidoglycan hydrolase CwlO-like protein
MQTIQTAPEPGAAPAAERPASRTYATQIPVLREGPTDSEVDGYQAKKADIQQSLERLAGYHREATVSSNTTEMIQLQREIDRYHQQLGELKEEVTQRYGGYVPPWWDES